MLRKVMTKMNPDDDQLNEMIARSDDEFNMFQELDLKRYK